MDGQYHEYVDKGKEKVNIEQIKPNEMLLGGLHN